MPAILSSPAAPDPLRPAAALPRVAVGIAYGIALLVICAHAGLIRAGQWQGDEYFNFALYRDLGVRFMFYRLFTYSPRPVSELLLYGYGRTVLALHRPLIGPMLAVCWIGLFAALAGAQGRHLGRGERAMLALVLFAMFLLSPAVSEMFYWPMAAAAYLFCLGGIALAVLRLAEPGPLSVRDRWVVAAGLLFGAWCAEVGCFFVACLCPLLLIIELSADESWRTRLIASAPWLLVVALSLPWLVLVEALRMHTPPLAWMVSPTLYHVGPSLRAGVRAFPGVFNPGSPLVLVSEALFTGGLVALRWGRSGRCPIGRLLALATALLATMLISMITAAYAYGSVCCERHATFRQCLVVLLLVVIAALATPGVPRRPAAPAAGPLLLAAALVAGVVPRAAGLAADYRADAAIMRATRATWTAGTADGAAMVFTMRPQGEVVHRGLNLEPGTYLAGPSQTWFIAAILHFFDKRRMTVPSSG